MGQRVIQVAKATVEEWQTVFDVLPVESEIKYHVSCACGNGRCEAAKKFKCTCKCHHANHGRKFKQQLGRLDGLLNGEVETAEAASAEGAENGSA
jgi:hypothetical protein